MFKVHVRFHRLFPVISINVFKRELVITVPNHRILEALRVLKEHINYNYSLLSCLSGVDFFLKKYRFCVVYDLLTIASNARLRLKIFTTEILSIKSIISVYICANWWEREVWDFFGVYFNDHNDLRRILTDYGFDFFPMRRDFPLMGFVETRYSEIKKRVIYEKIQLTQNYRPFFHESAWQFMLPTI